MKNKLDELPDEYFESLTPLRFRKNTNSVFHDTENTGLRNTSAGIFFWLILFLSMLFESMAFTTKVDIFIVNFVSKSLWIITILWLFPCMFFSSKKRTAKYEAACMTFIGIGFTLFRLTLLQFIAFFSASLYSNDCFDILSTNIIYGVAGVILIEELAVNILAWKRTEKCIIAGNFKKDGNGFLGLFGKHSGLVVKIFAIAAIVSPVVMSLSRLSIFLGKSSDIHIDGHKYCIPIIILLIVVYHCFIYIFAFGNMRLVASIYYHKRFVQSKNPGESQKYKQIETWEQQYQSIMKKAQFYKSDDSLSTLYTLTRLKNEIAYSTLKFTDEQNKRIDELLFNIKNDIAKIENEQTGKEVS